MVHALSKKDSEEELGLSLTVALTLLTGVFALATAWQILSPLKPHLAWQLGWLVCLAAMVCLDVRSFADRKLPLKHSQKSAPKDLRLYCSLAGAGLFLLASSPSWSVWSLIVGSVISFLAGGVYGWVFGRVISNQEHSAVFKGVCLAGLMGVFFVVLMIVSSTWS